MSRYRKKEIIHGQSIGFFLDDELVISINPQQITVKNLNIKARRDLDEFAEALSLAWKGFVILSDNLIDRKQEDLPLS
jgi:hypothetical protein